jgi:radical SAM-linked protein
MRIRITFAKTTAMRYTGHLDLYRAWERTLRRASLPLAYTHGFKPHPRINLASALPLGFTGGAEIVDIWLETSSPTGQIAKDLQQAAPPGLDITRVEEIADRAPTLQTELEASEFTITFLEPVPGLEQRLQELLAAESLPRRRRDKDYDLRPLIHEIQRLPDDEQSRQRLRVRLEAREGATGRPEEVILALGGEPENTHVHRERLIFQEA